MVVKRPFYTEIPSQQQRTPSLVVIGFVRNLALPRDCTVGALLAVPLEASHATSSKIP
jgi:hypothetical protein